MQEANLNLNRLDDLLNTINEARTSLQNWQDKRTEALIHLDSFTYDIKQIVDERARTKETIEGLQKEIDSHNKVYHSHVNDLTDQMQLLKLEIENLRATVEDKNRRINVLEREVEDERLIRDQDRMRNDERIAEAKAQAELQYANQIFDLKIRNEGLQVEATELMVQRDAAISRADRIQEELAAIRNQVLNVLHTKAVPTEAFATSAPQATQNYSALGDLPSEPVKKLRPMEIEAPSVDEYLKRLGY